MVQSSPVDGPSLLFQGLDSRLHHSQPTLASSAQPHFQAYTHNYHQLSRSRDNTPTVVAGSNAVIDPVVARCLSSIRYVVFH